MYIDTYSYRLSHFAVLVYMRKKYILTKASIRQGVRDGGFHATIRAKDFVPRCVPQPFLLLFLLGRKGKGDGELAIQH